MPENRADETDKVERGCLSRSGPKIARATKSFAARIFAAPLRLEQPHSDGAQNLRRAEDAGEQFLRAFLAQPASIQGFLPLARAMRSPSQLICAVDDTVKLLRRKT